MELWSVREYPSHPFSRVNVIGCFLIFIIVNKYFFLELYFWAVLFLKSFVISFKTDVDKGTNQSFFIFISKEDRLIKPFH